MCIRDSVWIISILALIVIIGGFTFFAPAKIKKYGDKQYYGTPNAPGFDEQGKPILKETDQK